jgi:hypothetical protein
MPRREWVAVVFPPVTAAILVLAGAADAGSTDRGWLSSRSHWRPGWFLRLSTRFTWPPAVSCSSEIRTRSEANRDRVQRIAIPLGWLLAGGLFVASLAIGGLSRLVIATALGGALIGFYPGLLANFLRLRKEASRS